ncbi:MAG: H-X9-DG-CTERM domain-containing protein, partial [Thermoguttaceae bacterium]
ASSYHTGGAVVGMCDGSVSFVSETVNSKSPTYDVAQPACGNTGPSHYGIWGAMGTRSGGESSSL